MASNYLKKNEGYMALSYALQYRFEDTDLQYLKFLREKYVDGKNLTFDSSSSWQGKKEKDFRKQINQLIKEIASKNKPSLSTHLVHKQSFNDSDIAEMFQNYLEYLCQNNFQQAENLIKKYNLTKYPELSKKLNKYSLKMSKYEQICQENKKLKNKQSQLSFYTKIIQNLLEPTSLSKFIDQNTKSPFMSETISKKLEVQAVLTKQKEQYKKICKGYEEVIQKLNLELKKQTLEFKYTNCTLANFSCKDFKIKLTEESGLRLKKSLADLVYNISFSKQKAVLSNYPQSEQLRYQKQSFIYYLLSHFLAIVSQDFKQTNFNSLEEFLKNEILNNKYIHNQMQSLKNIGKERRELNQFEKDVNQVSITTFQDIDKLFSVIGSKNPQAQKMEKIFQRDFLYRLMQQINTQQTYFTNQTILETILTKYGKWLDLKVVKAVQRLALKTGKVRSNLIDIRNKLNGILKMTGYQQSANYCINPNNTDFYVQMYQCVQKIFKRISEKNNSNNFISSGTQFKRDQRQNQKLQAVSDSLSSTIDMSVLTEIITKMKSQIESYQKLKKKSFTVFENFQYDFRRKVSIDNYRKNLEISPNNLQLFVDDKVKKINILQAEVEKSAQIVKTTIDEIQKFLNKNKKCSNGQKNEQILNQKLNQNIKELEQMNRNNGMLFIQIQEKNKQILKQQELIKKKDEEIQKLKQALNAANNPSHKKLALTTSVKDPLNVSSSKNNSITNNQWQEQIFNMPNEVQKKVSQYKQKIQQFSQNEYCWDLKTQQIQRLTAQITQLKNTIQSEKKNLNNIIDEKQRIINLLSQSQKQYDETKKQQDQQIRLLKEELQNMDSLESKILKDKQQEIKQLKKQKDLIELKLKGIESKFNQKVYEVSVLSQKITQIEKIQSLYNPLQLQMKTLRAKSNEEKLQLQQKVKLLEQTLSLQKDQYQSLKQKTDQLEKQKTQSTKKQSDLSQKIKQFTKIIETKQNIESEIKKQLNEAISQKQAQRKRTEQLEQEKTKIQEEHKQLKVHNEKVEEEIFTFKQKQLQQKQESKSKKQEDERFETENKKKQEQFKTQIQELKTKITDIQKELIAQKLKVNDRESIIESNKTQLQAQEQEKQRNLATLLSLEQQIKKIEKYSLQELLNNQKFQKTVIQVSKSQKLSQQKSFQQIVNQSKQKFFNLIVKLKNTEEELDEVSGFARPKPKPKKAHAEIQTDETEQIQVSINSASKNKISVEQTIQVIKINVECQTELSEQKIDKEDKNLNQKNQQTESQMKLQRENTEADRFALNIKEDSEKIIESLSPQKPHQSVQNIQKIQPNRQLIQETPTQTQDQIFITKNEYQLLVTLNRSLESQVQKLTQQVRQHEATIDHLQKQKIDLIDKATKFTQQLENTQHQLYQIRKRQVEKQQQLAQLQSQIDSLTAQYEKKLTQANTDLYKNLQQIYGLQQEIRKEKENLALNTDQLNQKISQLTLKVTKLEKDLAQSKLLIQASEQKVISLQKVKDTYAPEIELLKLEKTSIESLTKDLKQKIKYLESQKDQLKKTADCQKEEAKRIKKQSSDEIKKIRIESSREIESITKEKSSLEYKLLTIQRTGGSNRTESSSVSTSQLKMENDKLRRDHQSALKEFDAVEKDIQKFKSKINSLENQLSDKCQQISKLENQLNAAKLTLKQLSKSSSSPAFSETQISKYIFFDRFFPGQLLDDEHQKKFLLLNAIQKRFEKKIKKTKMIYRYDPLNPTNFHSYIDGKNNFLIVVKTHDNKIFGAFSTEKFQPKYKQSQDVESFIFTFNPETKEPIACFSLNQKMNGAKSLTWDQFFLKIGNSEIRWKMGESTIYSNFGITNGYYEARGMNVWALLQAGEARQTYMKGFECFQIEFEQ